ncbi:MAG: hypothetical protein JWN02_2589 [Acidobacteria bacterium]|nr:hypothetical protein [Acidobacteriota bacterium]
MFKRTVMALALTALSVSSLYASRHSASGVDADNLKEYGRGIIKDYSDLKPDDEIEFIWVAPGVKLSDYRFKMKPIENLTVMDDGVEETFNEGFPRTLKKAGAKTDSAPVLHIDSAIYWAEKASSAKRWIPYAGGHLAQAGVGIEMVFKNDQGDIVAKIRHSGREGDSLRSAAEELIDDVAKYIRAH